MKNNDILSKIYVKKAKYTRLFINLIVVFLLSPLIQYFTYINIIFALSLFSAIMFSINTLAFPPKLIFFARTIAVIALFCDFIPIKNNPFLSDLLSIIANLCFGLFLAIAILAIGARIINETQVNNDVIGGAICIYLMIGMFWYILYKLVYFLDSNAFKLNNLENNETVGSQLFYFSFTTLTTLGYGDITPLNSFGMMLTNGEALIGQLFPAIVIAKLVGLYEKKSN